MTKGLEKAMGFVIGELNLLLEGNQSIDGSAWENQAIFDFNNKALPVLEEFQSE